MVGIGQPTALEREGRFFQLADVFGVDQERFHTLSVDKYFPKVTERHFITVDLPGDGKADFGEPVVNTYPINEDVTLLRADQGQVQLAVNQYGMGRGVYLSGLPYSAVNARLLERILFYASGRQDRYGDWSCTNPHCEVAYFPQEGVYCVVNNTDLPQETSVRQADGQVREIGLEPSAMVWQQA